jgi:hypothetical protein
LYWKYVGKDTNVVDEPFYAHYLKENPHIERPYREKVLKAQPTDAFKVIKNLDKDIVMLAERSFFILFLCY